MICAPFKTRSLRFEWETTTLPRPLIAKGAMNGAQLTPAQLLSVSVQLPALMQIPNALTAASPHAGRQGAKNSVPVKLP